MHNVFKNDPTELRKKINKKAIIKTKDNRTFEGIIYTVDPVSESICLQGLDKSLSIIFPHAVKFFEIIEETIGDISFICESQNKEIIPEDFSENKEKLKNWLKKHMIPVEVKGEKLIIGDQLFITPPYMENNCISTNEVTLCKIQSLIKKMYDESC